MQHISVSCVIPVYRGRASLGELAGELAKLRELIAANTSEASLVEVVFVDDNSQDGSAEVLAELCSENDWMQVVTLSRNFGQHAATMAGILRTTGTWVVTLDEDLQHRPEWIWPMLRRAATQAADIVYARPTSDPHVQWYRNAASRLIKRTIGFATRNPHVSLYNSFRVIRGEIARAAAAVAGPETYLDVALGWFTDRVDTLPLPMKDPRQAATGLSSGYTLGSLIAHARRLLVSSPPRLLRYVLPFSLAVFLVAALVLGITLVRRLVDPASIPVQGWTSLMVVALFFGAASVALLGVIVEFQGILLQHSTGRPVHFVVDRSSDALFSQLPRTLESHEFAHH